MTFESFASQCSAQGLTARDCGRGHWQIDGGLVRVNYYPYSKRKTVWVSGTHGATSFSGSVEQAIEAARGKAETMQLGKAPKLKRLTDSRVRRLKNKWYSDGQKVFCKWCKKELSREECTIDHVVPLARGGGNYESNLVPACQSCNLKRGHELGELMPDPKNFLPGALARAKALDISNQLQEISGRLGALIKTCDPEDLVNLNRSANLVILAESNLRRLPSNLPEGGIIAKQAGGVQ